MIMMAICGTVWTVWLMAAFLLVAGLRLPWIEGAHFWLKWPALVSVIAMAGKAMDLGAPLWLGCLYSAISSYVWLHFKDVGNDDDYKKRLKRKAAEKVAAIGGRLVVVKATP